MISSRQMLHLAEILPFPVCSQWLLIFQASLVKGELLTGRKGMVRGELTHSIPAWSREGVFPRSLLPLLHLTLPSHWLKWGPVHLYTYKRCGLISPWAAGLIPEQRWASVCKEEGLWWWWGRPPLGPLTTLAGLHYRKYRDNGSPAVPKSSLIVESTTVLQEIRSLLEHRPW